MDDLETFVDPRDQLAAQMDLLRSETKDDYDTELYTAPIFTATARNANLNLAPSTNGKESIREGPFSQFGLIAGDISSGTSGSQDNRLFQNVSSPSSTFICGSQGSGKSHTLSCLLENCLIPCAATVLPRPLTALVFHYDTFVSDTGGAPCEAAYLSSHPDISVRVLCAPTNRIQIKRIYDNLPNVRVEELRIDQTDLNTRRMLDLMAVSSIKGEGMPLYLHVISRILRDLRMEQQKSDSPFNYGKLKSMIQQQQTLKEGQTAPLQQRLETLESFMVRTQTSEYDVSSGKTGSSRKKSSKLRDTGTKWLAKAGQLTIVDLSCPCVTAEMACSLFGICLSLFAEQKTDVGRVVALDEAHKYMTDSAESQTLTESLLSIIRLQRHLGARVVISTQEPTISPKLLDLCSTTIVHRFTSPEWLQALKKHLAGASSWVTARGRVGTLSGREKESSPDEPRKAAFLTAQGPDTQMDLFSRIVNLKTGEGLLFAPTAVLDVREVDSGPLVSDHECTTNGRFSNKEIVQLGEGILKVRVRKRITKDGGKSVMAS